MAIILQKNDLFQEVIKSFHLGLGARIVEWNHDCVPCTDAGVQTPARAFQKKALGEPIRAFN